MDTSQRVPQDQRSLQRSDQYELLLRLGPCQRSKDIKEKSIQKITGCTLLTEVLLCTRVKFCLLAGTFVFSTSSGIVCSATEAKAYIHELGTSRAREMLEVLCPLGRLCDVVATKKKTQLTRCQKSITCCTITIPFGHDPTRKSLCARKQVEDSFQLLAPFSERMIG